MSKDMTVPEAAARLGISRRTLMSLLNAKAFPGAYKAGLFFNSGWRIPERDVANFVLRALKMEPLTQDKR